MLKIKSLQPPPPENRSQDGFANGYTKEIMPLR